MIPKSKSQERRLKIQTEGSTMSQIDEMIQEFMRRGVLKESTIDNLKRFAAEVCKAMLEDCLPEIPKHTNHEKDEYLGCIKCSDQGVMTGYRNKIKERAEKWIK